MKIFSELFNKDENIENMLEENKQNKRKKNVIEKEYRKLQNEFELLKDKYISLLEEKGEGFNQYLHYYNLSNELTTQVKEYKKAVTESNSSLNRLQNEYEVYVNSILKYMPNIKECNKVKEFYTLLKGFTFINNEDIPFRSITSTCKRLNITKSMIKLENEDIYNKLEVENWKIED